VLGITAPRIYYLAISTEHGAWVSETLPSNKPGRRLRPRLPTTIRSMPWADANSFSGRRVVARVMLFAEASNAKAQHNRIASRYRAEPAVSTSIAPASFQSEPPLLEETLTKPD
jgi:hypothetical protein